MMKTKNKTKSLIKRVIKNSWQIYSLLLSLKKRQLLPKKMMMMMMNHHLKRKKCLKRNRSGSLKMTVAKKSLKTLMMTKMMTMTMTMMKMTMMKMTMMMMKMTKMRMMKMTTKMRMMKTTTMTTMMIARIKRKRRQISISFYRWEAVQLLKKMNIMNISDMKTKKMMMMTTTKNAIQMMKRHL